MKNLLYILIGSMALASCSDTTTYERRHSHNQETMDHIASDAEVQEKLDSTVHSDTMNAEQPARGGDRGDIRSTEGNPDMGNQYLRQHRDTNYMDYDQDVTLDKKYRKRSTVNPNDEP
jgi:hypothetical protein